MKKLSLSACLGLSLIFVGCSDQSAAPVTDADPGLETPDVAVLDTQPEAVPAAEAEPDQPAPDQGQLSKLTVGDKAPALSLAAVVQGAPVGDFEQGNVYVVEFWATWCGPCLQSMPHISALQDQYSEKVQFIGITDEDAPTVDAFMNRQATEAGQNWSEMLTYTIARDQGTETGAAWMQAAGRSGIPCAFIVGSTGNVEWIGHPMEIDEPLNQVVNGTWDTTAYRDEMLEEDKVRQAFDSANMEIGAAVEAGDFAGAVEIVDRLMNNYQDNARLRTSLQMSRLRLLKGGQMEQEYNSYAAVVIEDNFDNPNLLNEVAWTIAAELQEYRDLDLALKAARQAAELTKEEDPSILDTTARIFFEQGRPDVAVAWQEKAVAYAPQDAEIAATLQQYQDAVSSPQGDDSKQKRPKRNKN